MDLQLFDILGVIYFIAVVFVILKIIVDSDSYVKSTSYILLILLLPIVGIVIYLSFGINYRKREIYSKKLTLDKHQSKEISAFITQYKRQNLTVLHRENPVFSVLSNMFSENDINFATHQNEVKLLVNGENKFPELLDALRNAKHHIHIEYYIYENDTIGNQIADILLDKASQGVEVRFIYDDFGSHQIRKTVVPRVKANGVEAFPFYKIRFVYLANRLNYRNHRKIAVIDGEVAFVGGINVSDKYINNGKNTLFWRDTHIQIRGEAVWSMQNIFMADWNFCSGDNLKPTPDYFKQHYHVKKRTWTQIVSSGPDSVVPNILYSYLQAIYLAKEYVYITTPYFIPGTALLRALNMAVMRGVKVKLLIPGISDSFLVNTVSKSHYAGLLESGIEVHMYQKGFVHAKTMVVDDYFTVIGTANLDNRSFEFNFEVNAMVYDTEMATELRDVFLQDLNDAEKIDIEVWNNRHFFRKLLEKLLRFIAPLM